MTRTAPEVVQRDLADLVVRCADAVHNGSRTTIHANRARVLRWQGSRRDSVTESEQAIVLALNDMLVNEIVRRREESAAARHRGEGES